MEAILQSLPSLGISGLLFVMWWVERQERSRAASLVQESLRHTQTIAGINEHLLEVIRRNTDALAALREEFRAHREAETEVLGRLATRLERLAG